MIGEEYPEDEVAGNYKTVIAAATLMHMTDLGTAQWTGAPIINFGLIRGSFRQTSK
jgi:hypothetical protein